MMGPNDDEFAVAGRETRRNSVSAINMLKGTVY